jgi:hypothetical protein
MQTATLAALLRIYNAENVNASLRDMARAEIERIMRTA